MLFAIDNKKIIKNIKMEGSKMISKCPNFKIIFNYLARLINFA